MSDKVIKGRGIRRLKEAEETRKDEEFLKMMDSKKGSTQRSAASEDAYSYKCGGKVHYSTGGGVCAGGRSAIRGTKFAGVK